MIKKSAIVLFLIIGILLPLPVPAQDERPAPKSGHLTKVTLQLRWRHQFQFAGYYAAIEKGYYREAGLETILVEGGDPNKNTVDEVLSGRAQFGVTNSEILLHRLKGRPLVVLAAIFQHSPLVLVSRRETGLATPQDLVGKRVLLTRDTRDIEIQAMLRKEGLSLDQLQLVDRSASRADYFDPEIDALTAYSTNQIFYYLQEGVSYNTVRPATYGIDFYGDCLFSSEKELAENPERVKAFLEASLKGWRYAMAFPDELIEIITKKYNSAKTVEHLRFEAEAMQRLILPELVELGHMNPGRWEHIADTFVQFGLAPQDYDLSGFIFAPDDTAAARTLKRFLGISLAGLAGVLLVLAGLVVFNRRLSREISERRQTEDALRESEEKFLTAFRSNPGAISISRLSDGVYVELNDGFARMYGHSREEALGRTANDLDIWADRPETGAERNNLLERDGAVRNFEFFFRRKNQEIGVGLNSAEIVNIDGRPHVISISLDITDRKKAEEDINKKARELAALNSLAREVGSSLSVGHVINAALDQASNLIQADVAMIFLVQAGRLELRGSKIGPLVETFGESVAHRVGECLCGLAVSQKKPQYSQDIFQDPRCTLPECREAGLKSAASIPLLKGDVALGVITFASREGYDFGYHADFLETFSHETAVGLQNALMYEQVERNSAQLEQRLHDLKLARDQLHEEKERFRVLVEESPFGVSIINKDGSYQYVNPKFVEMFGYTLEDVPTGRDWFEKAFPTREQREKVQAFWTSDLLSVDPGRPRPRTFEVTCKNGEIKIIHFIPVTIRLSSQFVIYEDITDKVRAERELRTMEEQLLQAQKMEAVGALAGGIAHDFNNILSVIMTQADLAETKLSQRADISDQVRQIRKASARAADLVRQILTFSRHNEPEFKPLDMEETIREAINFLRATLPSTIELKLEAEPDLTRILADQIQIHQVLMNLCANAAHAIKPGGGRISIRLSSEEALDGEVERPSDLGPGPYQVISVTDTGVGMDKETISRIFEPFFSTKSSEEGTGLGLSVVHGIVKNHRGSITVSSRPGAGASFHVFLPATSAEPDPKSEEPAVFSSGRENILFVDDEEALVAAAKEILEYQGYKVTGCTSSLIALQLFRKSPQGFDLVITDQTMPGLTGLELSREMMKIRPDIRIILCTGYSRQVSAETAAEAGISSFCLKPFSARKIGETVRTVLDQPVPSA